MVFPPPIPDQQFFLYNTPFNNNQRYSYHGDYYDLNNKIMLAAIISLLFAVILVIVLHIYARCALGRQASSRAVIRSLGLNAFHFHSGEPPKTGLDPAVIASLPIFVYKHTTKGGGQYDEDDDASTECAVCLSTLEDQEMARFLPNCKHTFHADCIDKWLSARSTCPICRTEAEPRVQPEPREGPVSGATAARPNSILVSIEGTSSSDGGTQSSGKVGGSTSRLSSFRRMLSRDRSSRRIQSAEFQEEGFDEDLERQ